MYFSIMESMLSITLTVLKEKKRKIERKILESYQLACVADINYAVHGTERP